MKRLIALLALLSTVAHGQALAPRKFGGNTLAQIFSGSNNTLAADTSDAADDAQLCMAGGGAADQSRGAYICAHGNEFGSTVGSMLYVSGTAADTSGETAHEFYAGSPSTLSVSIGGTGILAAQKGATFSGSGSDVTPITQYAGTSTGYVRQKFHNSTGTRAFEIDADFSSGAEKLFVQSDTNTILKIGRSGDVTAYNGIIFDDAAGQDAMDYYDVGAWTPSLSFTSSNSSATLTDNYSSYARVGRVVHLTWHVVYNHAGTPSGTFRLAGLPWTVTTTNANYRAFGSCTQTLSGQVMTPYVLSGTTVIYFAKTNQSDLTAADTTGSFQFTCSITYLAN